MIIRYEPQFVCKHTFKDSVKKTMGGIGAINEVPCTEKCRDDSNKVYKKLIKLGNSYCLVIPKEIKTQLNIDTNTMLLVYSANGRVIVEPIYEHKEPTDGFEPDGPELIAARTHSNTKRIA